MAIFRRLDPGAHVRIPGAGPHAVVGLGAEVAAGVRGVAAPTRVRGGPAIDLRYKDHGLSISTGDGNWLYKPHSSAAPWKWA